MSQTQEISSPLPLSENAARFSLSEVLADYLSLTKPGVMGLLLISTCCPMILAAGGRIDMSLILWALLGGALVSGSASAINCIWDRDIDAIMERTKNRPIAAGRIAPRSALIFSLIIGAVGLGVLGYFLNPFAAGVALFGHLFYVLVYTMWLKRTTVQNIVIGGAAGAVPPVVGWVAITGRIDLVAVLLFLVVFLWTPPHFWALALNKNNDYKRAGVPMLPVIEGERSTHIQMLIYALILIPVSLLLVAMEKHLGWCSAIIVSTLGVIFAAKCYQLFRLGAGAEADRKTAKAWEVFGFSLVYLAIFFVCLVVDSVFI